MLTSNTLYCAVRADEDVQTLVLDVLPLSRCQLSHSANTSTHGDYCALTTFFSPLTALHLLAIFTLVGLIAIC